MLRDEEERNRDVYRRIDEYVEIQDNDFYNVDRNGNVWHDPYGETDID